MAAKLGIIAGAGELPKRLIAAARETGRPVYVLALEGAADEAMIGDAPHGWIRLGGAADGLRLLRENGCEEIVLAGGVKRPSLMSLRPDWRTAKFFARIGARAFSDDSLLSAVVKALEEEEGFRVVGADTILGTTPMPMGAIGKFRPDDLALEDIVVGAKAARALGALDIAQAVIVQQGVVLGVEAVEGTDALIARCAGLKQEGLGGVLVKLPKPGQERRADLPTIGANTVANAAAAGLRGIAVEAAATILLDRQAVIDAADKHGLFFVGIAAP